MGQSLSRTPSDWSNSNNNNHGEITIKDTVNRMNLQQLIQTTDISYLASIQSIILYNSSIKQKHHEINDISTIFQRLAHLRSLTISFDCSKSRLIDLQLISHALSYLMNLNILEINLFNSELAIDSTDLHVLCQNVSKMHKLNSLKIIITAKRIQCLQIKHACLLLKQLSQLKCLQLSVSSNVLGDKYFKILGEYLTRLRQLTNISLIIENKENNNLPNDNCNLINLDCLNCHLNNSRIKLTNNQHIIKALASLPNLKEVQLIFRLHMISNIIDNSFFSGIKNISSLRNFSLLEVGDLPLSESALIDLSKELKPCINLTALVLHLNNSKISIQSSQQLSLTLSSLVNLNTLELDFSQSHFESHGIVNVFESISQLNELENLSLFIFDSQINIDRGIAIDKFAQCLFNLKKLTKLQVSLSHTILVDFTKGAVFPSRQRLNVLFQAIGSLINLTYLSIVIGGVWIDKYEGLFSNWIKNLVNLEDLKLNYRFCNIDTIGISDLSIGISHLVNLNKIELSFLFNEFAVDWERIFIVGLSKLKYFYSFNTVESLSRQSQQQLMKNNVNLVEIRYSK